MDKEKKLLWLFDVLKTFWAEISTWSLVILKWTGENWWIVAIVSVTSFILTVVGCAVMITNLPSNYFIGSYKERRINNPFVRFFVSLIKNIVGLLLIIVGALMSLPAVPGQGLLTVLAGLIISDFPGKKRLARRIIRIRTVYLTANKIRLHFKRQPLKLEKT